MLIVALVVGSAALLPAAGSFVPRDSGNVLFGDEAHAACKSGLTNVANRWYGSAKVVTNWCYSGGHVTSRHSEPSWDTSFQGATSGFSKFSSSWRYSACHYYNGYWNHNCLTRREFIWYSRFWGFVGVCIHTRIYGGGDHSRRVTDGTCP